uniref:Uncharacterized protein n=1 Tax=Rhizophora mucronata TaxID=61149 RepID=A0A2P2PBZ1_RHIMU
MRHLKSNCVAYSGSRTKLDTRLYVTYRWHIHNCIQKWTPDYILLITISQ